MDPLPVFYRNPLTSYHTDLLKVCDKENPPMVFGSTLLEVAIGVIFVYLLLSLLCSAFSELIEAFRKYRARDLEKGITKLLGNDELAKLFFKHPLIKPLGERPSYVPARTFSLALWNLATSKAGGGVTQDLGAIRDIIIALDDKQYANIKTSLLTLIDEAGSDINKARTNIENWYNDAMDRVSGWYKRRVHIMLIIIGFIAAALLNVDTINIAKALWYNDTLRASVVAAADNYVKTNPAPTPAPAATPTPKPTPTPATDAALAITPTPTPSPSPTATPVDATSDNQQEEDAQTQINLVRKKISDIRGELNTLGLPVSWSFQPDLKDEKYQNLDEPQRSKQYKRDLEAYRVDPRRFPNNAYGWFLKVIGIFLTALAVSQGAPFWFDLLNKIIVIRSTIKPHEKSPEQPSKDTSTPKVIKKEPENENEGEENKDGENKG
jgi:hypothetical protein